MKQLPKILTSWDDGHPLDQRVAALLTKYDLPGIFFWPVNAMNPVPAWSRDIAKGNNFVIGGHTMTHPELTNLSRADAALEISECKVWLETVYQQQVDWFCYPRGRYNPVIAGDVEAAGFHWARTTKIGPGNLDTPFMLAADVHCYNRKEYEGKDWLRYALDAWEVAKDTGQANFHIWGHSWEIEEYNDWENLDYLFKAIHADLHS